MACKCSPAAASALQMGSDSGGGPGRDAVLYFHAPLTAERNCFQLHLSGFIRELGLLWCIPVLLTPIMSAQTGCKSQA